MVLWKMKTFCKKDEENKKTLSSIKKDSVLINMNINTVQNNLFFGTDIDFFFCVINIQRSSIWKCF